MPAPDDARFLPGRRDHEVAVAAPGPGALHWVGAPSVVRRSGGDVVLAYRRRSGPGRTALVVARSVDGVRFHTTAELDPGAVGAAVTERASLHRLGPAQWRMFASFAAADRRRWWVGLADASSPEDLTTAPLVPVFTGSTVLGFKDPVVVESRGRWRAYVCGHPLDVPGDEDRMVTYVARSTNGINWSAPQPVLTGRRGEWDARGARLTAVLPGGTYAYDGRASAAETGREQTGLAGGDPDGPLQPLGVDPVPRARYLTVLPLADGTFRTYYEAALPDGSHELRTELVPASRP